MIDEAIAPNCPDCLEPTQAVVGAWYCAGCGVAIRPGRRRSELAQGSVVLDEVTAPEGFAEVVLLQIVDVALPRAAAERRARESVAAKGDRNGDDELARRDAPLSPSQAQAKVIQSRW